jgi:hypothetical protein
MSTILHPAELEQPASADSATAVDPVTAAPLGSLETSPEQLRYARVLEISARVGLACLLITFALYMFGVLQPYIPLEQVHRYCTLSAEEYHREAHVGTGWSWTAMLGHGDFLNFIGITLLASVTSICYLTIIPMLLKRRDFIYAVLAIVQVVVLLLASSGVLKMGGH